MNKPAKRYLIPLFIFSLFFAACEKWVDPTEALTRALAGRRNQAPRKKPEPEAPTLHLDQADEGLYQIALNARDTLPIFFRHLLRPAKGEENFRIKYPFRADQGSGFSMEQLWLSDIRFSGGVYYGILTNTPYYIQSMKKGATVSFSADDITDWMYTRSGKIIGGLSIKYLLEQMPEHERNEEQREILGMFE